MNEAFINPEVAKWARERTGVSPVQLADDLGIDPGELASWERGGSQPPFGKAQALARFLHIPFGYLFLSKPPADTTPIPDLRTVREGERGKLSPDFLDVVYDALVKQEWYREFIEESGKARKLPLVGSFEIHDKVNAVAADLRARLAIPHIRDDASSWDEFLRYLTRNAETAGILVMRSGIVGGNTRRKLSVDEFRGFVISDTLAPLIFINGRDSRAAQIFTLAHELAHIWIDQSGISNLVEEEVPAEQKNRAERFCNAVAAEALVPREDFLDNTRGPLGELDVQGLAAWYRVSTLVILRRAFELDVITRDKFFTLLNREREKRREKEQRGEAKERTGGNFYLTLPVRNSLTLTSTVVGAFKERLLSHRDAARLLGVKTGTLPRVSERLFK